MGIQRAFIEFILQEHLYKPITGSVLSIGRQSISLALGDIYEILACYGIPARPIEIEWSSEEKQEITDVSFFALFTDVTLTALDVSEYEGAEIVHDLGTPIPADYAGRFDFIVNGSCLDNMFDPATALRNISKLLKPGGRVYHFEWSNSHPAAYLKLSPDWFMDYYAINNFDDCKVYVMDLPASGDFDISFTMRCLNEPIGDVWQFDPIVVNSGAHGLEYSYLKPTQPRAVFCLAEKGMHSSSERAPMQKYFRHDGNHDYIASGRRFRLTDRPVFRSPTTESVENVAAISDFPVVRLVTRWTGRKR